MNARPCRGRSQRALIATLVSLTALTGPVWAVPAAAAPAVTPSVTSAPPVSLTAPPAALPSRLPILDRQAHEQFAPLRLEEAWRYATGAGVLVAVLDSGVDADHPDLAGRVLPGTDFVDGSTDGRVDLVGHGTTVASLIAGAGDPAIGVAPEASILPVRVLDEQNRYQRASTVADGVIWAVDHGADVINLSLGGPRYSDTLSEALAYAMAHDVVVVACTGNDVSQAGSTGQEVGASTRERIEVWYPAREPGVVAVAGITFTDAGAVSWPASLTGPETVLAAPAVVTGAASGGGYRQVQGTSFASAVVAGTAALIRSRWPDLSAGDVVNRLIATADQPSDAGRNEQYGFGVVNPVAAVTLPVPTVPTNPLDTKARQARDGAVGLGAAPDRRPPHQATTAPLAAPPVEAADQLAGEVSRPLAESRRRIPSAPVWIFLSVFTGGLLLVASRRARRYRT
ncbi:MAG TPA: type VII secretion-associated serine protease mycosin [Natronosporangium sp.]|nr:type VII secretion-associated serine protease mycosin [Natronosporangium sp.]